MWENTYQPHVVEFESFQADFYHQGILINTATNCVCEFSSPYKTTKPHLWPNQTTGRPIETEGRCWGQIKKKNLKKKRGFTDSSDICLNLERKWRRKKTFDTKTLNHYIQRNIEKHRSTQRLGILVVLNWLLPSMDFDKYHFKLCFWVQHPWRH